MSHQLTGFVCSSALANILKKSEAVIRDKETVRQKMVPHTTQVTNQLTDHLMLQTGIKKIKNQEQYEQEARPSGMKKDTLSYRSINKRAYHSQRKQESQKGLSRCNSPNPSMRSTRKGSRKPQWNDNFIELGETNQNNGRKVVKSRQEEEQRIEDKLRKEKQKQNKIFNEEQKRRMMMEKEEKQKKQKMNEYLKNYMSKKGNKITFDDRGKVVYFNSDRQTYALRKKYPPSAAQFSFDETEIPDFEAQLKQNQHIKERAARGEVFASSVLKTMNISRISIMNNTCMIDEHAFMKRNDLFNNNHTRQISNIPYIDVAEGTSLTETNTNLSVSKKQSQRRTTHSETKSKFKTHAGLLKKDNSYIGVKSDFADKKDFHDIKQKGKKRAQSSYACRPKSSVPLTSRTGRITSVNEQLVVSMLQ